MGYNYKVNLNAYAVKFFADQRDIADLSDEALKNAFAGCILPAKERDYPAIRLRIMEIIAGETIERPPSPSAK